MANDLKPADDKSTMDNSSASDEAALKGDAKIASPATISPKSPDIAAEKSIGSLFHNNLISLASLEFGLHIMTILAGQQMPLNPELKPSLSILASAMHELVCSTGRHAFFPNHNFPKIYNQGP